MPYFCQKVSTVLPYFCQKYIYIYMSSLKNIVLLYFFIGFFSDFILNYLSRQTSSYIPKTIKVLEYYFDRKTIKNAPLRHIISGINAGLTIVGALLITMLLSKLIFGFIHPNNVSQLWRFILIAFCTGYAADVLIYKTQLFGDTLNPYYKLAGAGVWGALAFIFSILISFFLLRYART